VERKACKGNAGEQWIRWPRGGLVPLCNSAACLALDIEPFLSTGAGKTVEIACGPQKLEDMETYTEPRPEKIAPGNHHGVGILPTAPTSRREGGAADGKTKSGCAAWGPAKAC